MPEAEMARAKAATLDCDLFISIGSSLVVYPAAGFPVLARITSYNVCYTKLLRIRPRQRHC